MVAVAMLLAAFTLSSGATRMESLSLPSLADVFGASDAAHVQPSTGTFAVEVGYRLLAYPTREICVQQSREWAMALTLKEGGGASGRLRWRTESSRSVSEYASRAGKPQRDENRDEGDVRLHGTWTREDGWIRIRLADAGELRPFGEQELLCAARGGLLVCRVVHERGPLAELLNVSAREGTRWLPLTAEDAPWLVLGAAPGISLKWSDERGRTRSRVESPAQPLTEENLPLPGVPL